MDRGTLAKSVFKCMILMVDYKKEKKRRKNKLTIIIIQDSSVEYYILIDEFKLF